MRKILYILIILSITIGCKKIKPPVDQSEANEPIYKVEGLMNGDSLKLYVNDSTVFISNDPYDFNGIEAYSSTISDIENDFKITMVVVRPERYIDEEGVKLIENKDVDFLIDQEVCLKFSFGNSNQSNYFNIKIDNEQFDGGSFYVDGYGLYDATIQFPNINTQSYQMQLPVGFNHSELKSNITIGNSNSNLVYFYADTTIVIDVTHKWFIDDVLVSTQATFSDTINYGLHKVLHQVTDNFGNQSQDEVMFYMNNNALEWKMQLHENICGMQNYVANNYGRGFIEIERKGEHFSTLYNPNNTVNKLKVSNITYIVDSATQSIKIIKFNLNFNAELKNKNQTETILLENMLGVFQIKID